MTSTALRAVGLIAAVQALLRIGPLVIQAAGGGGLPVPGSFNDPAQALTIIRQSPEVMIVAGFICATGVTQVIIVLAFTSWLAGTAPQWARVSAPFGIIAAAFLMIDGALGIAALPQLAHLNVHTSAARCRAAPVTTCNGPWHKGLPGKSFADGRDGRRLTPLPVWSRVPGARVYLR